MSLFLQSWELLRLNLLKFFCKINFQVEKRKSFNVFLKLFLSTYRNWEPVDSGELSEAITTTERISEHATCGDDTVIGCFAGHPPEVILTFTQELGQLNTMITECKWDTVSLENFVPINFFADISIFQFRDQYNLAIINLWLNHLTSLRS